MRHGSKRTIFLDIDEDVTIAVLRSILDQTHIDEDVEEILSSMIKDNHIRSGSFSIKDT